jgi:hypothetical protein
MNVQELSNEFCTALLKLPELAWANNKRKLLPLEIERMFTLIDKAGDNCWHLFKEYNINHWREETRMWPRIDKWLVHNDSTEGNIRKTLFVYYAAYKIGGSPKDYTEVIDEYCNTDRATKRIWDAISAIPNFIENPADFIAQEEKQRGIEIKARYERDLNERRKRVSMFGHLAMMSIMQMNSLESRARRTMNQSFADLLLRPERVVGIEKKSERNLMKESLKRK